MDKKNGSGNIGVFKMRKKLVRRFAALTILTLLFTLLQSGKLATFEFQSVKADGAYFPLSATNSLQQNWSNANLITVNNDWSGVPSIIGYSGQIFGTVQDINPQILLADYSDQPYVFADITNPNSATNGSGGTANVEFQIANPVVGFRGSPLHDAPNLDIRLDTTACPAANDVRVSYNLRDIDGGGNDAPQRVALQYRIGDAGDYTNIPAGYVDDATTGPNQATLVTNVNVALPADAKNQPLLHVRILTSNATGVDEYVGIDDINISCGAPTAAFAAISGRVTTPEGKGIHKTILTLLSMNGETRTALTNNFGYYHFADVPTGETYIISLAAKQYIFPDAPRVINVLEDLSEIDFTGSKLHGNQ